MSEPFESLEEAQDQLGTLRILMQTEGPGQWQAGAECIGRTLATLEALWKESGEQLDGRDKEIARLKGISELNLQVIQELEANSKKHHNAMDIIEAMLLGENQENKRLVEEIVRLNAECAERMRANLSLSSKVAALEAALAKAPCQAENQDISESPCTGREDRQHCEHWYDGGPRCGCGKPMCGQCEPCKARVNMNKENPKPEDANAAEPEPAPEQAADDSPCPRCGVECDWKAGTENEAFRFYHRTSGFGSVDSRWVPCTSHLGPMQAADANKGKEKSDDTPQENANRGNRADAMKPSANRAALCPPVFYRNVEE